MKFEQVTFTPRYPFRSMYWTAGGTFSVLEYKDHLEVYRSDCRGRWRRRKTMPKELAAGYKSYRSYDLMKAPSADDGVPPRVVGRAPSFEIRDPAFMPREPNPVVAIKAEAGGVIWREGDDPKRWTFASQVADVFEIPLHLVRPVAAL